jgi:hypothetical protein
MPDKESRTRADADAGLAVAKFEELAKTYSWIPLYRGRQAAALRARGELRVEEKRFGEALADLNAARELLEPLASGHPKLVTYRSDLGKTYIALAEAARAAGKNEDATRWLASARTALRQAMTQSPDDVHLRKALDDLPK